jgi:sulfite exporter TauE/SafE
VSTSALIAGAALLGLAGAAHCTAMCAAPCAAVCRRGGAAKANANAWAFLGMRLVGYAAAGAVVATGVGALASLGALSSGLQPLWLLMHLAALGFGLWLLFSGRQPAWLAGDGRERAGVGVAAPIHGPGRRSLRPQVGAGLAGLAWVAWPCGLLQAALLMAALADGALGGAAVMGVFALCTTPGLVAGPWLWRRWTGRSSGTPGGPSIAWALRASGALLAGATVWALAHNAYVRAICSF